MILAFFITEWSVIKNASMFFGFFFVLGDLVNRSCEFRLLWWVSCKIPELELRTMRAACACIIMKIQNLVLIAIVNNPVPAKLCLFLVKMPCFDTKW
jgi:hypothetical protein